MFGVNKDEAYLIELATLAQKIILELHCKEPENDTFEQEGIIDGLSVIKEFVSQNEIGIAIEHLLYMVYESDISYPKEKLAELCLLASKYKTNNCYSS